MNYVNLFSFNWFHFLEILLRILEIFLFKLFINFMNFQVKNFPFRSFFLSTILVFHTTGIGWPKGNPRVNSNMSILTHLACSERAQTCYTIWNRQELDIFQFISWFHAIINIFKKSRYVFFLKILLRNMWMCPNHCLPSNKKFVNKNKKSENL